MKKNLAIMMAAISVVAADAAHSNAAVVINEVYGGGGNAGAAYTKDFVELYNTGTTAVSLNGYKLEYASAAGTTWAGLTFAAASNFSISAGSYFLVQFGGSGGVGATLPTADASVNTDMSGTAGKVRLQDGTVTGNPAPGTAGIIDFVGYGTTASLFEGAGRAPAPSNSNSVSRNGLHADSDNNNLDFTAGAPTPANSSTTPPVANNSTVTVSPSTISLITLKGHAVTGNVTTTVGGTDTAAYTTSISGTNFSMTPAGSAGNTASGSYTVTNTAARGGTVVGTFTASNTANAADVSNHTSTITTRVFDASNYAASTGLSNNAGTVNVSNGSGSTAVAQTGTFNQFGYVAVNGVTSTPVTVLLDLNGTDAAALKGAFVDAGFDASHISTDTTAGALAGHAGYDIAFTYDTAPTTDGSTFYYSYDFDALTGYNGAAAFSGVANIAVVVPEPVSLSILALGAVGMMTRRRRASAKIV